MVERFGRYDRTLEPGVHLLKWPMEREAGRVGVRIHQLDLHCETKSKDRVFVDVRVSIQYQANSNFLFEAFYSLESPTRQLTSQTLNVLRSNLPQMDLDDIFSSQDSIALELHRTLNGNMNKYGYTIQHALLTRIHPNDHVKQSMNEMEASKRMKEAMPHKAEAVKIECVKNAEARAERAYLNGVGVARERRAIAKGMRDVVDSVNDSFISTVSSKGVMDLLVLTQYFDVLTSLNGTGSMSWQEKQDAETAVERKGEMANSSLILNYMPATVQQLQRTARECFGGVTEDTIEVENLLDIS